MKVVQINTFPYKATGNIMLSLHDKLLKENEESYVIWGRGRKPLHNNEYSLEDRIGIAWHIAITRLFDRTGFASKRATSKLLFILDQIEPDIVHLHNIHGYYLNIPMLFKYLIEKKIKTVWTLHDCWAITGHCAYFDAIKCNRWKTGCFKCPQKRTYPASIMVDCSSKNWRDKKRLFDKVDLTIVTVSNWLKNIVDQSYLNNHRIVAISNGISKSEYHPVTNRIKEQFGIENKKLILGVASEWTERKGLQDIVSLANILPSDEYAFIVIGLNKKQLSTIDSKVIGLGRMKSKQELLEFYSAADIFFNASIEETMGMTTVEAIACGTIPVVYNATALPEVLNFDRRFIAEKRNVSQVADIIQKMDWNRYNEYLQSFDIGKFSKENMVEQYYQLYVEIYESGKNE